MQGRGRGRGRARETDSLLSLEPDTGPTGSSYDTETMTWAKTKSQMLNRLSTQVPLDHQASWHSFLCLLFCILLKQSASASLICHQSKAPCHPATPLASLDPLWNHEPLVEGGYMEMTCYYCGKVKWVWFSFTFGYRTWLFFIPSFRNPLHISLWQSWYPCYLELFVKNTYLHTCMQRSLLSGTRAYPGYRHGVSKSNILAVGRKKWISCGLIMY